MKNRNYLIIGTLFALVLLIIFARLTIENSFVPLSLYLEGQIPFGITICLFSFFIIAFSDINQVSSSRLTKYRLRWLMDMSIYWGFLNTFINLSCDWIQDWSSKLSATDSFSTMLYYNWNVPFIWLGNLVGIPGPGSAIDFSNLTPIFKLSSSIGIISLTFLYALLFSFSFYLLSFFVKDKNDGDSIKLSERTSSVSSAFIVIMGAIFISLLHGYVSSRLSILVFFNKYIFLFLFSVFLVYYFQPGASLSMLIKNLFYDCDEVADSITAQIRAIIKTKRIIMCLCFIAVMFIPTAIFGGLTFHAKDSFGIFKLLANSSLLLTWSFLLLLFLTALEGKYNYKLFHQNGSMIEDGMFLPKFVALPIILFFLMIVVLFILFNVLF